MSEPQDDLDTKRMTRDEALATFNQILSAHAIEYRVTHGDALALREAAINFAHATATETLEECCEAIRDTMGRL
jgi:pyrimidine deaminase RibD-like protein